MKTSDKDKKWSADTFTFVKIPARKDIPKEVLDVLAKQGIEVKNV